MSFRRVLVLACVTLAAVAVVRNPPARAAGAVQRRRSIPQLFAEMRWRNIGPYRAGRTKAAAGMPSQPYIFYIGMVQRRRLEDDRRRPHLEADLRRSADRLDRRGRGRAVGSEHHLRRQRRRAAAARPRRRRRHLQVDRRRQDVDASRPARRAADSARSSSIRRIPNRLFVAALGHPYGPNEERGIFRSTDGGKTFEHVLYKDENTGGNDVDIDPSNPDIVYATLWEAAAGPVGERRVGRHQRRPVQVDRRRHDVDAS